MSHDTLNLGGVALPGGGTVLVNDTSPGGTVPRVELHMNAHPPALDPAAAGGLADLLLTWAVGQGYMPRPTVQWDRWALPDPDVFAVLIERALTGEEPTVENFDRYAAAYREACRIAAALPEVLGLLEQYQAAFVVDAVIACGPECSEMHTFEVGRCEQAGDRPSVPLRPMPTVRDLDALLCYVASTAAHVPGDVLDAHDRLRQTVDAAQAARADFLDKLDGHEPDPAQVDDLPGLLQRLVAAWGALGVARLTLEGVPEADRAAWLHALAHPWEDATREPIRSDWRAPASVPLRPMPTVRDLEVVLSLARVSLDRLGDMAVPVEREAVARLTETVEAAKAARADFLDQLDGREHVDTSGHDHAGYSEEKCVRCGWVMGNPPLNCQNDNTPHRFPSQGDPLGRDGDPVEDEDGAPLPPSVQFLLTCARRVVQTSERGTAALAAHIADLARALEQVESESRR